MRPIRLKSLPEDLRREIREARRAKGWSQEELARKAGLAQRHISTIETGKIVPRYDTLLDILRVLDHDLVLVPRELLSAVQALLRDYRNRTAHGEARERPLYAVEDDTPNG
jgi:transcriptional regulator with XRE-family HTH domain